MKLNLLYAFVFYTVSLSINLWPYDNLNKNKINDKPTKCILLKTKTKNKTKTSKQWEF